jgi:hypothetical protein
MRSSQNTSNKKTEYTRLGIKLKAKNKNKHYSSKRNKHYISKKNKNKVSTTTQGEISIISSRV